MEAVVDFIYQTDFKLSDEAAHTSWIKRCASHYGAESLALAIAFMSDESLHALNQKHLDHDTLTDIITFDDTVGKAVDANIAISIDRVRANAQEYTQPFEAECLRVISHGLLHCLGFGDKTVEEQSKMRNAEEGCIKLFHVEQNTINHV